MGVSNPALEAPRPRGPEQKPKGERRRRNGGTREAVIAYLGTVEHAAGAAIAAGAGLLTHVVHQMLGQLLTDAVIVKTLPPGRFRGAVYRLVRS